MLEGTNEAHANVIILLMEVVELIGSFPAWYVVTMAKVATLRGNSASLMCIGMELVAWSLLTNDKQMKESSFITFHCLVLL